MRKVINNNPTDLLIGKLTIREYLLKRMIHSTYSEMVADEDFVKDTGIKCVAALGRVIKKNRIDLEQVYIYGIDNGYINMSLCFLEWLRQTNRVVQLRQYKKAGYTETTDVYNRIVPDVKESNDFRIVEVMTIKNIASRYGLEISINEDMDLVLKILEDLIGGKAELSAVINKEKKSVIKQMNKDKILSKVKR